MLRWYIYGEVFFSSTQRRNQANTRLDNYVSGSGWVAQAWERLLDASGTWPSGRLNITRVSDTGVTFNGIRFCYYTLDEAQARAAMADIVTNWNRAEDVNSSWGYTAQFVP